MNAPVEQIVRLGHFRLAQTTRLPFNVAVIDRKRHVVLCGEIAHLSYRIQMQHERNLLRQQVDEMLAKFAHQVGVDE